MFKICSATKTCCSRALRNYSFNTPTMEGDVESEDLGQLSYLVCEVVACCSGTVCEAHMIHSVMCTHSCVLCTGL